ncbi:MAG: hypothetical protein V4487_05215 [Chlamydiota bacterium]
MLGEEIIIEIDTTLDQLIRNAEVIQNVDLKELSETEIEGFQKTQESLLQHLLHMDQFLETKSKSLRIPDKRSAGYKIQEKLLAFEKLKSAYSKNIKETAVFRKNPILSKRRSKKFLNIR